MKKLLHAGFCLVLALLTAFQLPLQVFANTEKLSKTYISDISVGSIADLEAAGYTVVYDNLNDGGTGLYAGYKTTQDVSQAITDVSALDMYDGYSELNYGEMLLNTSNADELGRRIQTAVNAFRSNYYAGNPYAALAYEALNVLVMPDDNGNETPLGDLFLSGGSLYDYKRIALMCSNTTVGYIFNMLCLGVSDDTSTDGASTWLKRLSANGPLSFDAEMTEGEIEDYYTSNCDSAYMQRASYLFTAVRLFANDYQEALASSGSLEAVSISSEAQADAFLDEACETMTGKDTMQYGQVNVGSGRNTEDMLPLAMYEVLNQRDDAGNFVYPYGTNADGTERSLAQFFIEVGSMAGGEDAYRALYPLIMDQNGVTPLTVGQETMMYHSGLSVFIILGSGNPESISNARSEMSTAIADIYAENGGEKLSIWYDVNTRIYEESQEGVYWTSKLAREAAASNRYDLLTKPQAAGDLTTNQKLINAMIIASAVCVAAVGAAFIAGLVAGWSFVGLFAAIKTVIAGAILFGSWMSAATGIAVVLGTAFLAVAVLAVVAVIVIALVILFKWLFGSSKEEPELELTEMPKVVYDYNDAGSGSAVIYDCVRLVGTDTVANLNDGRRNTPWVTIYYTKDTSVGDPIIVETDESGTIVSQPFTFQIDDQQAPSGYVPLCFFESVTAANLNEGISGAKGLFGFMHKASAPTASGGETGGESGSEIGTGIIDDSLYLKDVILVSESTEEAAKALIVRNGYNVLDFNITRDSHSYATYIGYQTTEDPNQAVCDLRVAYATGQDKKSASITFGDTGYGICGAVGNLQLFETKVSSTTGTSTHGTPILASSLIVTDTLREYGDGYEPVNLFCGGPAFDFNSCDDWAMTSDSTGRESIEYWDSHAYIYFLPSVAYTAENSTKEYLGGLSFFAGYCEETSLAAGYIETAGWTPLTNANLGNGMSDAGLNLDLACGVQEGKVTLCYTTTYNPYRAITGISYYSAEPLAGGVAYNINTGTGMVACDVFQQRGAPKTLEKGLTDKYKESAQRLLRPTHSYRSHLYIEGGSSEYGFGYVYTDYVQVVYGDDGLKYGTKVRCTALYVAGPAGGKQPIEVSELYLSSSSSYNPSSATPVRSIINSYSGCGANLQIATQDVGDIYLYISRPDPYASIPKYIASVTVSYQEGDTPFDSAVYNLVGNGAGQLLKVNLTGQRMRFQDNVELALNTSGQMTSEPELWCSDGDDETSMYYEHAQSSSWETTKKVNCRPCDSNEAVALVWVTYTNTVANGISDLVLCESATSTYEGVDGTFKTQDGANTVKCGDGFKVDGSDSYFFIRAVRNNGNQITDLVIDDNVMYHNYWTSISIDGTVSNYDMNYIKARHLQKGSLTYYISGIYTADGDTEIEAQKALLAQGCRYCVPYNLSPDNHKSLFMGYSLSTSYKNAYSGMILHDAGQDTTEDTIVKGKDTYIRVADSLNSGVYDSIIGMYVTKSTRIACQNGATSAKKGRYITDITLFTSTDLNDYATGAKSLGDLDVETRAYVESYITDKSGDCVYWNLVKDSNGKLVNCNIGDGTPAYMYIHYSDNYLADAASNTGSTFSEAGAIPVALGATGVLCLAGLAYLLVKRRKKNTAIDE